MCSDLIKEKDEVFKESKKRLMELNSAANPLKKDLRDVENMILAKSKEISNQETGFKAGSSVRSLGPIFAYNCGYWTLDKNMLLLEFCQR